MSLIGWITEAEADTYFGTRLGASSVWVSGADKVGALTTAYNDLINSHLFTFPTYASGEEAAQILKDSQCEQALFLLLDQDGIDRRTALKSQGVLFSGLIRESYKRTQSGVVISCRVETMLTDYWLYGKGFKYTSPATE